jgi:hypothetical protein
MSIDQGALTAALDIAKQTAKRLDTEITAFKIGEDFRIHAPESKERGIPVRVTPGGILTIGGLAIAAYALWKLIGAGGPGGLGDDANKTLSSSDNPYLQWLGWSGARGAEIRRKLFGV